jgi:hypothetical protein
VAVRNVRVADNQLDHPSVREKTACCSHRGCDSFQGSAAPLPSHVLLQIVAPSRDPRFRATFRSFRSRSRFKSGCLWAQRVADNVTITQMKFDALALIVRAQLQNYTPVGKHLFNVFEIYSTVVPWENHSDDRYLSEAVSIRDRRNGQVISRKYFFGGAPVRLFRPRICSCFPSAAPCCRVHRTCEMPLCHLFSSSTYLSPHAVVLIKKKRPSAAPWRRARPSSHAW